ncbi:hypothetical protein evm_007252 [Chilo suppressalis]|nr:hypothetical protein evm_007252 [Chilo suppressalis]
MAMKPFCVHPPQKEEKNHRDKDPSPGGLTSSSESGGPTGCGKCSAVMYGKPMSRPMSSSGRPSAIMMNGCVHILVAKVMIVQYDRLSTDSWSVGNLFKMSFVDLATLTLHRRNELEARTKVFLSKCDQAIDDIQKLKVQAQSFASKLNCEPSELKERFLKCMEQLDEYMYLITDFNLSVNTLEEINTTEIAPVHDSTTKTPLPTPRSCPINLIDVLSEPLPSTSTACSNHCPSEKPKRLKVPKEDQLLIAFSSTSCSSESVPQDKIEMRTKEVQCEITADMNSLKIKAPQTPIRDLESCNLPAQKILLTDHLYKATIMSIDGASFWVITDNVDEVCGLMKDMTEFYKSTHFDLTLDEISMLSYCAFCDEDCFYRAFFIKLIEEEEEMLAEVFLVDTGEVRTGLVTNVQPLEPQFCTRPPYARCCHLAGIDMLSYQNKELSVKQAIFMKEYMGISCTIEIDDNTSESLGVYVILPSKVVLNDVLIKEGLALPSKYTLKLLFI